MLNLFLLLSYGQLGASASCNFAQHYECSDFFDQSRVDSYLDSVMQWEGRFASPGIGYDAKSGFTYDGQMLDYNSGGLYGEPHLFSAPSKESIHVGILALAVQGDKRALLFSGGYANTIETLQLKIDGYMSFNKTFPGYGCFTPWVGFNAENGTFSPLESWSTPYYQAPGLDNGEWFWALYGVAHALKEAGETELAQLYEDFVNCQKKYAKDIFYRGDGKVSDVVYILNAFVEPFADNYQHISGYLNDPYEGETMTMLLYLFSDWSSEEERDLLWTDKRAKLKSVDYIVPKGLPYEGIAISVQEGYWFSTHEQWKALLLPYFTEELQLVKTLFHSAEVVRTMNAVATDSPGLLASVNDVTNGSQNIDDYISATGVPEVSSQLVARTDVITPYGSYAIMLQNLSVGLCWYNNMLQATRMQNAYGSTEAININGTEICPLVTWDSKITTVLAMLGGVGDVVKSALLKESDEKYGSAFDRFVYIIDREYKLIFENSMKGTEVPLQLPKVRVPKVLSEWKLACAD